MASNKYVKASEIGEYVYCPRAWWLQANGLTETTLAMQRGTEYHNDLGKQVDRNSFMKMLALVITGFGVVALILALGALKFLGII